MKVAINAEQLLYHSPGGIGRYVANLVALVPRFAGDGSVLAFVARHRADDIARAWAAAGLDPSSPPVGLPLPRPALYEGWHRAAWPSIGWRRCSLDQVDLIHAPSVAVPPKRGKPLVVTVHDAAPFLFPEAFTRHGRAFHRLGMEAARRRADLVVTVSHAAAAEISAHAGIPEDRLRVVPGGIDPPTAPPARPGAFLGERGLAGRRYLLWVGSLEPRKNVGTAVAAVADLVGRRPDLGDVVLVLAGYSGWLGATAVDAGARDRLGASLHEVGRVTEEQLWELYAGATAFVFPSVHEGFGLPVVEAMSQGIPVVCSDLPVLREVAGDAAVFVPPRDAPAWADVLEGLLDDDTLAHRLARKGLERAPQFTATRQVAATVGVYREVLGFSH
jgi:glycosyltransferase involved in cell wall biosynthesis